MTTVVLGAGGQVGRALARRFPGAVALDRAALDLGDPAAVAAHDWTGVDLVINAAAYTQVDAAQDPANRAPVRAVNVDGVGVLADAARAHRFLLVHFSSEYVFDGGHPGAIPEDAPVRPLSVYGQSKADGDRLVTALDRHLLVRTTWVVGEGRNFVRTMTALADRGVSPSVVADQMGRLSFAEDLAAAVAHLVERGASGTYNATCGGEPSSWADVAEVVFAARGRDPGDVRRVSTAEYTADKPDAAPRPLNSVLDLARLEATGFRTCDWRTALDGYLSSLPTRVQRS